ncbi:hypothetical protein ROHU_000667 [Labeo rohita]|uniref:Uncharacterized protein n=1 Tax=Labeo rohita TaxID=84645 RepID=A0A498P2S4_LABRO|nr:hypothetical protein ROHU_000667 [Labeo rohita]
MWKAYGTTSTLPRSGCPSKVDDRAQEDTDKRSYQEAKGNFERLTRLYGWAWSRSLEVVIQGRGRRQEEVDSPDTPKAEKGKDEENSASM